MRIVSRNSDADLARGRAEQGVGLALRELAANLIRVMRGAGQPQEIGVQAAAFVDAVEIYQDLAKRPLLVEQVRDMLDIARDEPVLRNGSDADWTEIQGHQAITRGALQIAASRLLAQPMQEGGGRREIEDGLRLLECARAKRRRETAAAAEAARKAALPRKTASPRPPTGFLKPRRRTGQG
ncbi:hypothetical protein KXS07_24955 [Inquilinus limosus]|uniref:hypothetical protein n=1 Tax=Inquilinus limosus TaxID=171674 RepID=UPI003F16D6FB